MKSYGRAPTFLLVTGYEQVRSVAAALDRRHGSGRACRAGAAGNRRLQHAADRRCDSGGCRRLLVLRRPGAERRRRLLRRGDAEAKAAGEAGCRLPVNAAIPAGNGQCLLRTNSGTGGFMSVTIYPQPRHAARHATCLGIDPATAAKNPAFNRIPENDRPCVMSLNSADSGRMGVSVRLCSREKGTPYKAAGHLDDTRLSRDEQLLDAHDGASYPYLTAPLS